MTKQCSSTIAIVFKKTAHLPYNVGDYLLGRFLEEGGGRLPKSSYFIFVHFTLSVSPNLSKR